LSLNETVDAPFYQENCKKYLLNLNETRTRSVLDLMHKATPLTDMRERDSPKLQRLGSAWE